MRVLMVALLSVLAMGAAPPAYDPVAMTAPALLERADKATGTLAPGSYLRTYVSDGGGLHTDGSTKISGDDRETVERTGPFTASFGIFHGQQWRQNENGVVIRQTGFHDTEDPDANALSHADSSTTLRVLGITHDAPQQYILEVAPLGAPRELRYYDAQTYLLDRIEITGADRRTRIWTFSRYRPVFGELIPYTVRFTDGRPANDTVTTISSFMHSPVQIAGIPPSRKLIDASHTAPIAIPALFGFSGIVVPVTIGGSTYNFLLDSGSDGLMLAPQIAAKLGYKQYDLSTATIGGEPNVSQTVVPELAIGGLHLNNVVFKVAPINKPDDNDHLVGVLGLDFWTSAVVGIDFKNKTVTLYPASTTPPDAGSLGVLPITVDDGVPRAAASIEGVQGFFKLDTGSSGTVLFRHYFDQLPTKTSMDVVVEMLWMGGTVDMAAYTVNDLAFGSTQFKHANVAVPPVSSGDDPQYDGLLGRNVMEYYTMYFDYEGHAVYLKPNI
jgi:hypothetical protein